MIKLSIVVPIYNVEKYISRCITSILNNKFNQGEIEVILVDDDSKDDSILLAKHLINNLKYFKIISQENKGLGGARNTGLKNALGEYVWFIDSDDEITNNSIDTILKYLSTNNDIYIYNVNYLPNNPKIKYCSCGFENIPGHSIHEYFLLTQVWRNIYKRDFLNINQLYFKEKFLHEDGEFNLRTTTFANKVTYRDVVIYNYYTNNSNSIMNNITLKNQTDLLQIFNSVDELKKIIILNSFNKKNINNYLGVHISLLFINSTYLKKSDFLKFYYMLKSFRLKILKASFDVSFKLFFLALIMIFFKSFFLNNLIYHKKLKSIYFGF